MYSKRKVIQIFNNNPQRSRLRGRPKKRAGETVHKQVLINAKSQNYENKPMRAYEDMLIYYRIIGLVVSIICPS